MKHAYEVEIRNNGTGKSCFLKTAKLDEVNPHVVLRSFFESKKLLSFLNLKEIYGYEDASIVSDGIVYTTCSSPYATVEFRNTSEFVIRHGIHRGEEIVLYGRDLEGNNVVRGIDVKIEPIGVAIHTGNIEFNPYMSYPCLHCSAL